jgi:hypothetical protein
MSKLVKAVVSLEIVYRLKPEEYHTLHCGTVCLNDCEPRMAEGLEGIAKDDLMRAIAMRVQHALGTGDAAMVGGIVQLVKAEYPDVKVEPL